MLTQSKADILRPDDDDDDTQRFMDWINAMTEEEIVREFGPFYPDDPKDGLDDEESEAA